jgi:hypothetical protein
MPDGEGSLATVDNGFDCRIAGAASCRFSRIWLFLSSGRFADPLDPRRDELDP